MRSYHVDMGAGIEGIRLREGPEPRPGPHEVSIRVRAVSLNFRELSIAVRGVYPLPVKPDVIPVSDGAGEVVAVGDGVTRAKVGDRVAVHIFPRWLDGPFGMDRADQIGGSLDGMLTEVAVVSEDALVAIPEHLSFAEAATLPCAGVTAWNALTGGKPLHAGETVLVIGSGGVSLFALQFARLHGASVIATTSSADKKARLEALGAGHVIVAGPDADWSADVRRLTGGRGVDQVVEVGGPGTLEKSLRSLATGGQVSWVGTLADGAPAVDLRGLFNAVGSLRGIAVGSRAQFIAMNRAVAAHRLRPIIDRVFPFEEARAAFSHYATEKPLGKVVIEMGPGAHEQGGKRC